MLGHVGLRALEERPYQLVIEGHECFVYDIGVRVPPGVVIDDRRHANVRATFEGLLAGDVEPDGFNRLVLFAGLTAAQANVLRCYAKYANQIGFTFSQRYIEDTLARLPQLATLLVELFEARFDPDLDDGDRIAALAVADAEVLAALDAVPSLDEDRIGRMFLALIRATVRTSAFQGKPTVAFKFDPSLVPDLPAPRPQHEIFVCSSRVEGVHLRGGAIARGGLRWSDRPEDYRTEVLGLVKAQMVKNAVIVPVGAKGGFVVKRPKPTPAENRDEGVECYRMFVRGLLDLTDNVVDGEIVPPARTRALRRRRPLPRRRRRQGHGDVQRHRQRGRRRVRVLARRRVRLRRQRRLRPQGDGHHRPRRVGERAQPRPRARQERRPRRADRGRHRRHVGRRVRQRDAALAARQADRGLRPPPRVRRSRTPTRRRRSPSASACTTRRARRGPTTTRP